MNQDKIGEADGMNLEVDSVITSLIIHRSFTLSPKVQNLPFQQIFFTLILLLPLDCLHDHGTAPDLSCLIVDLFLVRFFFIFFVCPVWRTKLTARQFFTAR